MNEGKAHRLKRNTIAKIMLYQDSTFKRTGKILGSYNDAILAALEELEQLRNNNG